LGLTQHIQHNFGSFFFSLVFLDVTKNHDVVDLCDMAEPSKTELQEIFKKLRNRRENKVRSAAEHSKVDSGKLGAKVGSCSRTTSAVSRPKGEQQPGTATSNSRNVERTGHQSVKLQPSRHGRTYQFERCQAGGAGAQGVELTCASTAAVEV
jgi:hypothetical protein